MFKLEQSLVNEKACFNLTKAVNWSKLTRLVLCDYFLRKGIVMLVTKGVSIYHVPTGQTS